MQTDYIPRKDHTFFMFQKNLSETVQKKLSPWNINVSAFDKLQTARTPYETAYNKKADPANRTKTDVSTHRKQRKAYTKTLRSFVKEQIAGNSSISDPERIGMSLKPSQTKKGKRTGIESAPMVSAKTINGGWISMNVRVETDSNRSSMHPLADAIEVIYMIGDTQPASHAECITTLLSTKAKFTIKLDLKYAGKKIFGYAKWKNIRNDKKSSSWGNLFRCMIAD